MKSMRASGGSFDEEGALPSLKPQWLAKDPHPSSQASGGVKHPFLHSTDRGRGRRFGDDRGRLAGRRLGAIEGIGSSKPVAPPYAQAKTSTEEFPPLPPFYRSHSTGSLTPSDSRAPSASSRLLKEEKTFSINRECDFPTLATAVAVVEQPAKMNKSKSATALPQAISPSLDLLKAYQTTLSPVTNPTPLSSPNPPPAAASNGSNAGTNQADDRLIPAGVKPKPSFSSMATFSAVAADKAAVDKAAANKAKFQQSMAARQAELQKHKSLVPSRPVHPALPRPSGGLRPLQQKPRVKKPLGPVPPKTPAPDISSPSTIRKATSAPVLTMATIRPRSPPLPSPLSTCSVNSSGSSGAPSTSPPRPAVMMTSRSARTLPQATSGATPTANAGPSDKKPPPLPHSSRSTCALPSVSIPPSSFSARRRESLPATPSATPSASLRELVTEGPSPPSSRRPSVTEGVTNSASKSESSLSCSAKTEAKPRSLRGSASKSSSSAEPTPEELAKLEESMWMAFENGDRHHRPEDDEEDSADDEEEEEQEEQDNPVASQSASGDDNDVDDLMSMEPASSALAELIKQQQQHQEELSTTPVIQNEFTPYSWEMLADEEWSEFSEDRVLTFMKRELGYEGELDDRRGSESADEGDAEDFIPEEEILLTKQRIAREQGSNLQELLEKKRRGLSESLMKWQPPASPAAVVHLASEHAATATESSCRADASKQRRQKQTTASRSSSSKTTNRRGSPSSSSSSSSSSGGGGLRASSGASDASLPRARRSPVSATAQVHIRRGEELDSDSDDTDGDDIHSFHGIVFG